MGPSDEKQFESMQALHIVHYIMDMDQKAKNPLFCSPISNTPQNILDIGTGTGIVSMSFYSNLRIAELTMLKWAMDVADRYPSAVYGMNLYPPPEAWVPPNCKLEGMNFQRQVLCLLLKKIDDALKEWTYKQKFDLIHMR